MKWRHVVLIVLGIGASTGLYVTAPFPDSADAPVLVLMEAYAPILLMVIHAGYFAMPGVLLAIGGMLLLGVWRVWFEQMPDKKPVKGGGCRTGRYPMRTTSWGWSSGNCTTRSRRERFPTRSGW